MSATKKDAKQRLTDAMLEELIKHVGSWIAVIGNTGKMSNRQVNAATRVDAAKTGINLVIKLMTQSSSYDGDRLLSELDAIASGEFAGGETGEEGDDGDTED